MNFKAMLELYEMYQANKDSLTEEERALLRRSEFSLDLFCSTMAQLAGGRAATVKNLPA